MDKEKINDDFLITETIKRAKKGDREAARTVLEEVCASVDTGRQPDRRYLEYLSECFHLILDGKRTDMALGVENPDHRPSDSNLADRDANLAIEVMRQVRHGIKPGKAIAKVAKRTGLTRSVIAKAWRNKANKRAAEIYFETDDEEEAKSEK